MKAASKIGMCMAKHRGHVRSYYACWFSDTFELFSEFSPAPGAAFMGKVPIRSETRLVVRRFFEYEIFLKTTLLDHRSHVPQSAYTL